VYRAKEMLRRAIAEFEKTPEIQPECAFAQKALAEIRSQLN
jgi:hypothetical protein